MSGKRSYARRLVVTGIAGTIVAGLVTGVIFFLPALAWLPLAIGMWQQGSGRPSSYVTDRGAYFRVSARYLVDEVEPLDFDVVVACGRNRLETAGSDQGAVPTVYARRTSNNHAVLIGIPEVCLKVKERLLGQRRGVFDGSFIPFAIWFDNADNLEFGLGYASIYAYQNPAARLTFLGASVRYATREEFADWYTNSDDNLITNAMLETSPYDEAGWLREDVTVLARECHGIGFAHVNAVGRETLAKFWPGNKPDFWSAALLEKEKRWDFEKAIKFNKDPQFGAYNHPDRAYLSKYPALDWKSTGSFEGYSSLDQSKLSSYFSFEYFPSEHYPVYYNDAIPLLKAGEGEPFLSADIVLRPEAKGFVACYTRYDWDGGTGPTEQPGARHQYFGSPLQPNLFELRVNGAAQFQAEIPRRKGGYLARRDRSIGEFSAFFYTHGKRVD